MNSIENAERANEEDSPVPQSGLDVAAEKEADPWIICPDCGMRWYLKFPECLSCKSGNWAISE